ncbi:MAG: fused DNA polymerase IV/DNA polymerase III subunit alpha [Verrucomicrobia bacterium]|nr:MAG: fused DNA polymerase IV/DNA polymerase III subunit alpha [Verrucomicrobiota bacterium]
MPRAIVHLDADAFFASVEQAADARLRGKPVAVGGEKRGIIASASYEARKFGVFAPMPTVRARKLCPNLIVLPGDFEKYERFSRVMFSFAHDFTPDVEQSSIDEGYFDLSAARNAPVEIALAIRAAIGQSLKIPVSEGIGGNKLVSQIASKLTKPGAFAQVPPGREIPFLHPLPSRWLPGIGPKTETRLRAAGLAQIKHISATPLELLELLLGRMAAPIKQFSNGIDERPIVPADEPAKSFSRQETFTADVTDEEYAEAVLRRMADHLFSNVREEGKSIRTLTVKVRYNDMAEDQCGESLLEPTGLESDIYGRLHVMLRQAWKRRVSLRMVSLKLSNVYDGRFHSELPLDLCAQRRGARARLAVVIDELRKSRGQSVILRGHDFRLRDAPHETVAAGGARLIRPVSYRRKSEPSHAGGYVPLRTHSHYSFLDSTLSPTAIVQRAKQHGLPAVALTDTGNLHGVVEFVQAAQSAGIKPIIGAEVCVGGHSLLLYAADATGYFNLSRILSRHAEGAAGDEASIAAKQRQPLKRSLLADRAEGLLAVSSDASLADFFPGCFFQAVTRREGAVACPAVHYATPEDRRRYDILQSIRTLTLLEHEHPEKRRGGRYHFRAPAEMATACADHPEWLRTTHEITERCDFEFPFGKPQFPAFQAPEGSSSKGFLRHLVLEGLQRRYTGRRIVSDAGSEVAFAQVRAQVEEELSIIADVGYEDYFLITWDFLQECRRRGIEWITRGSAADSLVCYCLGISSVCPIRFGLYFRRFLNQERMALNKLPDIDIDFAHDFKDDMVKLIFAKYGPEHCAVVGGFSTFQARSAFAEAAKVLGVGERAARKFTEHFPWGFGGGWVPDESAPKGGKGLIELLRAGPETHDLPLDEEPYRTALEMAEFLDGMPRYPKMHPCGLVLSRQPMHELTPTFVANKGYSTTHFDMDAVEAIGLVKMDILAQGGLAAMRDVKAMLGRRDIEVDLDRCLARNKSNGQWLLGDSQASEPWQDAEVWEMIAGGGARAVHHIESPAMTSLCCMSNVREIDGLIAIVSVIRPGAANEGKKLAFTRRYQGVEPVAYPHPSLEACLRSTYGLVVYEEHILQLSEAFAGLPPGRADVLRRALNKQNRDVIAEIRGEFFASARTRGHAPEKVEEVWGLVTGFAGYAFCKAHSTAYGVEAYQSAWLKRYFPAEFMAAVLSNGKGFYHPLVYVLECHRLGIPLLPPTVNQPGPAFTVSHQAIRVPLIRVKGLTERTRDRILQERGRGAFVSMDDFYRRVMPAPEETEAMIRVGAFDEFGKTRTAQFWEAQFLRRSYGDWSGPGQGWLLPPAGAGRLPQVLLREPTRRERLRAETELLGFTVSGHPLELYQDVAWDTYCPVSRLNQHVGGEVVSCGLVIEQRVHHQVTGEPMKFLTLADWTGMVESELFAQTYKSYGLATVRYPVLAVTARVEPFENGRGFTLRILRASKPRIADARKTGQPRGAPLA